jgi:glycosyltransferase involved in cell wall biosynthesis
MSNTKKLTVPEYEASIVISTFNRAHDLVRCIKSCLAQDTESEIIVYDDASDDGTAEAVRRLFPEVRLFVSRERRGQAANRNCGLKDASSPFVVSIDDDAYFSRRDIVHQVVAMLNSDRTIGAVAIPYIEPLERRSLSSLKSPFNGKSGQDLRSYVGCAHALRRDVALRLGGYRDFFGGWHEERDFCVRLRSAGWRIVYGDTGPVVHMVSTNRDQDRITYYGGRNQVLCETLNVPFPDVLWRVGLTSLGMIRYRFSWSTLPLKMRAIGAGLVESARHWNLRAPVTHKLYHEHRRLLSHGPEPWEEPVPPPCYENHQSGQRRREPQRKGV